jgi:hypothetical protein
MCSTEWASTTITSGNSRERSNAAKCDHTAASLTPAMISNLGGLGHAWTSRLPRKVEERRVREEGYAPDQDLFTTEDDECGGLDSTTIRETAEDTARGCKEACGTLREGVRRPLHLHHLRARSDGMRVSYRKAPWRLGRSTLNLTGCG